jgi:hypothetical protein
MEIELSVKVSEEDYIKIAKSLYKNKTKYGWSLHIMIILVSLMMLIPLLMTSVRTINFTEHKIEAFWILLVVIWYLIIPQMRIRNYRKIFEENKNINSLIHYNISDEFLEAKTALSESKTSWQAIIQVQELTDWFLLRPNTVSFHALPKNQLNQSQQAWLRDKITKK